MGQLKIVYGMVWMTITRGHTFCGDGTGGDDLRS